jgi:hypothetical protein
MQAGFDCSHPWPRSEHGSPQRNRLGCEQACALRCSSAQVLSSWHTESAIAIEGTQHVKPQSGKCGGTARRWETALVQGIRTHLVAAAAIRCVHIDLQPAGIAAEANRLCLLAALWSANAAI